MLCSLAGTMRRWTQESQQTQEPACEKAFRKRPMPTATLAANDPIPMRFRKSNVPQAPVIVWFRADLRLDDNPALAAAAESGQPVLAVYILDTTDPHPPGGASKWWLHHSLSSLAAALARRGIRLVLRRGNPAAKLLKVVAQSGATSVVWNRAYDPHTVARDTAIKIRLKAENIACQSTPGELLVEPWAMASGTGRPYRIFTPFYKALLARTSSDPPLAAPRLLSAFDGAVESDDLVSWSLCPSAPDWAGGLREVSSPGEDGARRRLLRFIDDDMGSYGKMRDIPSRDGTSRLSPHLAFGELGSRRVWHTLMAHPPGSGRDDVLRQLAWREFARHLLFHLPEFPNRPMRAEFEAFPWVADTQSLRAWQRGRTGYPIVDAGMRQLWRTGWMHNRVRMIVASFLTKHLRIDWRRGAAWFWDTLVDADLGNNTAGWQWVAGCGTDAAPYFRVFNPTLQGRKFDPDGDYVRRWVPELALVPSEWIHQPWLTPGQTLADARVTLGRDYPHPIVDHASARAAALAAYRTIRA